VFAEFFSKHTIPEFSAFSSASISIFIAWCKLSMVLSLLSADDPWRQYGVYSADVNKIILKSGKYSYIKENS